MLQRLKTGREAFEQVVEFVLREAKAKPNAVFAGSVPYLMLAGSLVAGWQLARSLLVAEERLAADHDRAFMEAKVATARFYAEHLLVRLPSLRDSIVEGADSALGLELEAF